MSKGERKKEETNAIFFFLKEEKEGERDAAARACQKCR
jgi:hypothetical protein